METMFIRAIRVTKPNEGTTIEVHVQLADEEDFRCVYTEEIVDGTLILHEILPSGMAKGKASCRSATSLTGLDGRAEVPDRGEESKEPSASSAPQNCEVAVKSREGTTVEVHIQLPGEEDFCCGVLTSREALADPLGDLFILLRKFADSSENLVTDTGKKRVKVLVSVVPIDGRPPSAPQDCEDGACGPESSEVGPREGGQQDTGVEELLNNEVWKAVALGGIAKSERISEEGKVESVSQRSYRIIEKPGEIQGAAVAAVVPLHVDEVRDAATALAGAIHGEDVEVGRGVLSAWDW